MVLDLDLSPTGVELKQKLLKFVKNEYLPSMKVYKQQYRDLQKKHKSDWVVPQVLEDLKVKAKNQGLWNIFLPKDYPEGPGLTNLDYAHMAEIMGRYFGLSEVCNCSAPDTGNMEVLAKYGSPEQKKKWLVPLMNGDIRSVFFMTEPKVASSDATNIETQITREGNNWVINGRKWWSSGVMDPRAVLGIVMGKSSPSASSKHRQQSMIIVPLDTPGIKVLRALTVFGYNDAPHGHGEVVFENVKVPLENMILGEGRGFEIAQGRLGPGRIHHCMRTIGITERCMELMHARVNQRVAFGRKLKDFDNIRAKIAQCRIKLELMRVLTLKAAAMIDKHHDAKGARLEIAMIKIVVPNYALQIIDEVIQVHGGAGLSQDYELAYIYAQIRTLRFADGPDEVHERTIARMELLKPRSFKDQPDLFVPEVDADTRPMCIQEHGLLFNKSKL